MLPQAVVCAAPTAALGAAALAGGHMCSSLWVPPPLPPVSCEINDRLAWLEGEALQTARSASVKELVAVAGAAGAGGEGGTAAAAAAGSYTERFADLVPAPPLAARALRRAPLVASADASVGVEWRNRVEALEAAVRAAEAAAAGRPRAVEAVRDAGADHQQEVEMLRAELREEARRSAEKLEASECRVQELLSELELSRDVRLEVAELRQQLSSCSAERERLAEDLERARSDLEHARSAALLREEQTRSLRTSLQEEQVALQVARRELETLKEPRATGLSPRRSSARTVRIDDNAISPRTTPRRHADQKGSRYSQSAETFSTFNSVDEVDLEGLANGHSGMARHTYGMINVDLTNASIASP